MKKYLISLVAALLSTVAFSQTAGDLVTLTKAAGIGDTKTYSSPVNSTVWGLNNVGAFTQYTANTLSTLLDGATDPFLRTSAAASGITELTGEVTAGPGSGSEVATISNDAVTNAKLNNMAQATIKGRGAGTGTGDPQDLTADQVSTILDAASDPFVRTSALPGGTGDVVGPGSAVDDDIALFDGITGKLIKSAGIHLGEVVDESGFGDVGLIESSPGFSPITLKDVSDGDGTTVQSNTGSFQINVDPKNSIEIDAAEVQLVGDAASPGNLYYYGTDGSGTKGFHSLAGSSVAIRTGSTIAFDIPAVYNDPTTPSSGAVTLDLTGAIAGVEVVGYFNHSVEPTWPAGVTAYGTWYNSNTNVVRFLYVDASNISATIENDRPVSEWRIVRKSSATTRNSTSTLAADPTLTIPIAANESIIIRGFITITSAATPDFKYRMTGPASPSEVRIHCVHSSTGTAPSNTMRDAYDSADLVFLMTATQSGTIALNMEVVNGANAGNIAFEWAQNTSDAGNTTVRINSYLEYQIIP